jgi:hypothetical protein
MKAYFQYLLALMNTNGNNNSNNINNKQKNWIEIVS